MAHDEPAGRMATRPGMISPSSTWNRWPPPAASSHDQFFSVVKKARPTTSVSGGSTVSKAKPVSFSTSLGTSKLKLGVTRPGPSKAPLSLLKAPSLRMGVAVPSSSVPRASFSSSKLPRSGVPSRNIPESGAQKPGHSRVAAPSKICLPRPGPPAGINSKVHHPSAGARPRAPSGGAPRPAPDPFRPKPSAAAPKPRMSWDLDLLTDGSPEDAGDSVSDLEQSPAFLTNDFNRRPGGTPSLSMLDRFKTSGLLTKETHGIFPKSGRSRPPKTPGEQRVKRKYIKKKQAANGAGGPVEKVDIQRAKPKWKGASEILRNDLKKAKVKDRQRKEKLIAVRMDGSVPQVVTLLPKNPSDLTGPVPVISPVKDGPPPKLASPIRKLSSGSDNEPYHGKPETKPLFEHIDQDWAVIKKSLEKAETKKERKLSDTGSSPKTSSLTLTPSSTKKSDQSDELSTDDDISNDLNAPLHNLEKLQDEMIKNLMDDGALAAVKSKRQKQKEVQVFKKNKMSDYWKNKLGPGESSFQMKTKRPYTVRPLTSDNVKHMEEAIAAVLAAPSPETSPEKRPAAAGSQQKLVSPAARAPGFLPSPLQRQPSGPNLRLPSPSHLLTPQSVPDPATRPTSQPASQSPSQSVAMSSPPLSEPKPAMPVPPSSTAAGPAASSPKRRTSAETESDPTAAARLLQVKQELATRFLSDLHQQRAQLQAAEQQRVAWQQQQQAATAALQQQEQGWRPLIRVRQRRRAGQPRIVRLTEAAFQSGNTTTDANIGDDGEDDGLMSTPELHAPPPVSIPASKLKEFLDTARVSRFRRMCESGLLVSAEMQEETPERMVFVSERPLPSGVEQTLIPTGQGLYSLPCPPSDTPWPAKQRYAAPLPPAGVATGWSSGVVSPVATAGRSGGVISPASDSVRPGQPAERAVSSTPIAGTPITVPALEPTAAPTATLATTLTTALLVTTATPIATPTATATPNGTPDNASDSSMEERPLQIVLPATPSAEQAVMPAGSAPSTPLSVSPRVAPAPVRMGSGSLSGTSSTPVPGTPAGVSPRVVSGASTTTPSSPRLTDPENLAFACNRCPARLATLSEQVYHEIWMHMTEENLFRCLGCPMLVPLNGDVYLVLDGLLDHYMKHVDEAGRLLAFDTSGDFFRCEFCPRVFEDPAAYGAHEVQCRSLKYTCATCQGRFETGDLLKWHEVDHLQAPDGKYCCDHCDSKFTKREQLLGHRRFHFKDKNVECPKCGKKFMTTGMLAMHNKWKHSQGPCRFCGRPFTSATARQAHEEHTHLKHMMHMCDVCHFRVMTATQLRVHKRTHSDDKPHRCVTCAEAFVSKNLLKKHRTARHSKSGPAADGIAAAETAAAPAEPSASQSGGESARAADGSLTTAELRQLFERYTATWTGPKDDMTLSDYDTEEDEDERRNLLDSQAKEELYKTKDKNTLSVWSCPVCHAFFTKLWGVRAHITLKHPGSSAGPVLHDDKDTSAVSKQDFLKEIKRNAKTAKRELKMEAKRQARIAAYGDELPRRGRPRKFPDRPLVVHEPFDPSQPRKRGRPRKNPDDPTASPQLVTNAPPPPPPLPPPPPPPPPPPKSEPPPDHVERRLWKCLTCEDQSQSYDDLVTHTYIAHPNADLPRFEVVITYVPKPTPKTPAEPATPPPSDATPEPKAQQDHDAAILDAARVRGAEKRRAPSATKVPAGAKRRNIPSAVKEDGFRGRGRGRGATAGGGQWRGTTAGGGPGRGATAGGGPGRSATAGGDSGRSTTAGGGPGRSTTASGGTGRGATAGGGRGRSQASSGDSYRKSYSNSSRRFKADDAKEPAAAADDADKLYCYCQSPYDEVSEMIGCDNDDCKHEWFHFECVGIVIAPKGKWFCPDCSGDKTKTNK